MLGLFITIARIQFSPAASERERCKRQGKTEVRNTQLLYGSLAASTRKDDPSLMLLKTDLRVGLDRTLVTWLAFRVRSRSRSRCRSRPAPVTRCVHAASTR